MLIHKVSIYGKIRCGNITFSVTLLHGEGSGTASRLTDLGFEQFVYDNVTDTACFIKQTDISDTLLEFEEAK